MAASTSGERVASYIIHHISIIDLTTRNLRSSSVNTRQDSLAPRQFEVSYIMFSTNRNPLQLLLIPVCLIVILFFTLTTNKGTYPPPVKQHDELSIPSDAEDWEFDGALKKIQQDSAGLGQVEVDADQQQKAGRKSRKVQLDLTVMSRCPDAVSRSTKVTVLNR
jgi:hypothetical protein